MISRRLALGALLAFGSPALGQQEPAAPEASAADAPIPEAPATALGRFQVGALYLTPYIHIGTLGFDSNVQYSATEREPDFTASGGPGLEVLLPVRRVSRLTLDGALDYLYFARNEAERRLNGYATARLNYDVARDATAPDEFRPPQSAFVGESFMRTSSRPSLEVDARVPRTEEQTQAGFSRPLFGRLGIEIGGRRGRFEVEEGVEFVGNDLQTTMTRDEYGADAGIRYSVTIKTALVVRGDFEAKRHDFDASRDGNLWTATGGIETDRSALIAGHALFGLRWFESRRPGSSGPAQRAPEIDLDAMWNLTPRTRLGGSYRRSLDYSAFEAFEGDPTGTTRVLEARIEKDLGQSFDLRLYGRQTDFATTGEVVVEAEDGGSTRAQRDDRSYQAGASLGYRFRPRVRISVDAEYLSRQSNFDDFGVEGLLVGFAVGFTPGDLR